MSATQELLAEQIRETSEKIAEATSRGEDPSHLKRHLQELNKQLASVTSALTENVQLLKG